MDIPKTIEKLKKTSFYKFMKQLIFRFSDDAVSDLSAQITYYLLLAFFPFLLFLINIISLTPLSGEIAILDFSQYLPKETADILKSTVVNALEANNILLLLIGLITSLWAASKGISAITKGLNKAYDVKETRGIIMKYALSILYTFGVAVMILLSITFIVFGEVIGNFLFGLINAKNVFLILWSVLRYLIPLFMMFVTFSLLYKYLPNRKLRFRTIYPGALFTTLGWIGTSLLFSFYVNNFANYEKVYGSLGGVIALLIWLNLSTLIILVGGEINASNSFYKNKEKNEKYEAFR